MTEMQRGVHCHHRRRNKFQYTCPLCGLHFMQHAHLTQHRVRRHGLYCFTNTVKLKQYRSSHVTAHRFFRRIHESKEVSSCLQTSTSHSVDKGHNVLCEPVRSPGSRDSGIDESSPSCREDETNSDVSPVHHMTQEALRTLPNNVNMFTQSAHTSHDAANSEQDVDNDFFGCLTSQCDVAIAGFGDSFVPCPELVTKLACEQYEDMDQMQSVSLLCDWELAQHGQKGASVSQASAVTLPSVHSKNTDTDLTAVHISRTESCSVESLSQASGGNKTCIATCDNGVAEADLHNERQPLKVEESPGDLVLEKGAGTSGAGLVRETMTDDEDSQTISYEFDDGCGHLSDFDTETSDTATVGVSKVEMPSHTNLFATGEQEKARLLDNILLDVNGNGQCLLCPKHSSTDCKMCTESNYRESIGSYTTSSMALLPLINGDDPKLSACPESDLNFVQSQELQCSSDVLMPTQALSGIDSFSCVGDSSNIRMVDLGHDLLASGSNAALPQLECFQFDDRDAWMSNEEDSAPAAAPMFYIGDNADSSASTVLSDYPQDEAPAARADSVKTTKNSDNEQRSISFASEFYWFLKQRETKRLTRSVSISHVRNKLKVKDDYSPVIKRRHSCFETYNLRPKRRKTSQCECCMCDRSSEPTKPFRANAFIKNQLLVNSLRQKVVQLFDVLFPDLEYPQKFSPDSPAVEILMDKVMAVVQDRDPASAVQAPRRAVTGSGECRVVLCKSPLQCLKWLRRKVCRMLQLLLPDLKFDGSFERQSAGAEQLLQEVIDSNLDSPKTM